jgi:hypothetical protein
MQRRRIVHIEPLDERLAQEAHRLKEAAKSLKPGQRRQEILRKARQAEMAASITQWITSPGLQPPE